MPKPKVSSSNRQGRRMFLGKMPMFMGDVLPMQTTVGKL